MRRHDRERDAAFAWAAFDQAPYATLSLRDREGGYGVPVSPARIGEKVYFHCAMEGHKLECLARWPEACLSAVGALEKDYYAVRFRSAVLRGRVSVVEDEAEKRQALAAIARRYCPEDLGDLEAYLAPRLGTTCVCRMDVAEITGKERMPK